MSCEQARLLQPTGSTVKEEEEKDKEENGKEAEKEE
jgi:hypothetical protein